MLIRELGINRIKIRVIRMDNKQLIESLEHHLLEFARPAKDYNQIIQDIKASEVLTPEEKRIAIEKAMKAERVAAYQKVYQKAYQQSLRG